MNQHLLWLHHPSFIFFQPIPSLKKKNEIILDSFKLNFNLHSILLNLSYYFHSQKNRFCQTIHLPLSCLNYKHWLLIITNCKKYLTHREIHIQCFFREQCIWTLNEVKPSMRKFNTVFADLAWLRLTNVKKS